jgi:RNA methyltransferase, TrmH family
MRLRALHRTAKSRVRLDFSRTFRVALEKSSLTLLFVRRVTSRQNQRLREAARLLASARERRKAGRCVLEGEHSIAAFVAQRGAPDTLIVDETFLDRPGVRALADAGGERTITIPAALFAELATPPEGVGIVAVVDAPHPAPAPAADFCLLIEDVQDPGNVGSMLRSAAAAGVAQAFLSRHCAFAWSPKVLRAAQGAHFHLDIFEDVDLHAWTAAFHAGGGRVVATAVRGGVDLFSAPLAGRIALAIGNEGAGLSPALAGAADVTVTIPMPGGVESLNAAAAAAVCLFECVRQRARQV